MTNRRQWKLTVDFIYSDRPRGTDIASAIAAAITVRYQISSVSIERRHPFFMRDDNLLSIPDQSRLSNRFYIHRDQIMHIKPPSIIALHLPNPLIFRPVLYHRSTN